VIHPIEMESYRILETRVDLSHLLDRVTRADLHARQAAGAALRDHIGPTRRGDERALGAREQARAARRALRRDGHCERRGGDHDR
jgi:hypothetical protein